MATATETTGPAAAGESRRGAAPYLAAIEVTKAFPGVVANDRVSLEVNAGEVHALLGENGSGKTTLCKIFTGLYRPDRGRLEVDGKPVTFHSPRDAHAAGIFMVQQHFSLVERLTVAENMVLGLPRGSRPRGHAARAALVAAAAERYQMPVDPDRPIWQLSVGERQRVEILKALMRGARTLILDEPTTVLTPQECQSLFATLRGLAGEGTGIIFISHKLREVLDVSDRVTVLRKGAAVATVDARHHRLSPPELARMMVGRPVELAVRRASKPVAADQPALEVTALRAVNEFGRPVLDDVSFVVQSGEIVGLAGVAGNGQRELAEAVSGLRAVIAGSVRVGGRPIRAGNPRSALDAGVAYVPEDRFGMGLVPDLCVADNLILKRFDRPQFSRWSLLDRAAIASWADGCIDRFSIKGSPATVVRQLSGGNAQKVVLARELTSGPRLLVVAAPTRGLDVGAMDAVRQVLIESAEAGIGVLLISEDLDEVLEMSDRIVVMFRGGIVGSVPSEEADRDHIGLMMAGMGAGE